MRRGVGLAACAVALAGAVAPAAARADKVITAEVVWRFDAAEYTIDQGEPLTFKNTDGVSPGPHNVTAKVNGADGQPLFRSDTIKGDGSEVAVAGAQQLTTGDYAFYCTVHPFMTATLHVTGQGTPAPAPGSEPAPSEQPAPDTTRPRVSATVRPTTLRSVLRTGRLTASVTAGELVALRVSLTARVGGRTVTLAQATRTDGAPRRRVDIPARLTAAGRRALRGARRLVVSLVVQATDPSGNATTVRARRILRR